MSERITFTAFLEDSMSPKFGKISHTGTSAFEKLSVGLNKVHSGARNAGKSISGIGDQVPKTVGKIEYLESRLKLLEHRRRIAVDDSQIRKINKEIDVTQTKLNKLTTVRSGGNMLGGMMGMIGGVGMVYAGINLGKQVINTRKEFETYEAVLKNTLGSEVAMKQALGDIQVFAAKTPFSVNELTDAYIKLTNQGFQPTMQQMTKLGDLSSSVGKSFGQLSEAIIDATVGEFERLKEFGIKASKEGDKITFTFKGQKTEIDNTSEAIRNYILSLGDMKGVSGSMEAISKTLSGQISNLGDSWDKLLNTMGKSHGVFSQVIQGLGGIFDKISNTIEDQNQKEKRGFGISKEAYVSGVSDGNDFLSLMERDSKNASTVNKYVNDLFSSMEKDLKNNNSSKVYQMKDKLGQVIKNNYGGGAYLNFMNEFSENLKAIQLKNIQDNTTNPETDGKGDKTKKNKLSTGLDSVSGDSGKIRNLTINIDKQIEKVEVNSSTAIDSVPNFIGELKEALATVVNNVNYMVE